MFVLFIWLELSFVQKHNCFIMFLTIKKSCIDVFKMESEKPINKSLLIVLHGTKGL